MGSKVGIGIGVPFAVIVIGILAWIGLILRKFRVNETEPTAQTEVITHFQDKTEFPTFTPMRAGVASGSSVAGELP